MQKLFGLAVLLLLTSCTKNIETSNIKKKTLYSIEEYIKLNGNESKSIGDEYIKILKNESLLNEKYTYALEHAETFSLEKNINTISKLFKGKELFDKQVFNPFDESKLSRIIYNEKKALALVSFGFKQDKWSIRFEDFLLKIKNKQLLVYTLENSVGCEGPAPIFDEKPIDIPVVEINITKN